MQLLGLLSFIILILGLALLVFKWPKGIHVTFSGHAAATKFTIIYYNLLLTVVMVLLSVFILRWFVPTFHLSVWFSVCIIIASIFEYIATLIPEVGGWKTKYHRTTTLISVIFLLPPMVLIIFTDRISILGRIMAGIDFVIMLGILGLVAVKNGKQRYNLLLQIGYYVAFFMTILVAPYL